MNEAAWYTKRESLEGSVRVRPLFGLRWWCDAAVLFVGRIF